MLAPGGTLLSQNVAVGGRLTHFATIFLAPRRRGAGNDDRPPMEPNPHIAVVDDHQEIRELVSRYLEQHGYRVTPAENAAFCASRWIWAPWLTSATAVSVNLRAAPVILFR